MSHTPAPWHVRSLFTGPLEIVANGFGTVVAMVAHEDHKTCSKNAELIAAAPDLLAALEMVLEDAPTRLVMDAGQESILRATIKKARGE